MIACKILDVDYYLPENRVSNQDILRGVEVSPDYIENKLGIIERRFMGHDETTSSMGAEAARALFAKSGNRKEEVDLLIAVTQSPDHVLPGIAPLIQRALEISNSVSAFDLNLACSGYPYALAIAATQIQAGLSKQALIVTSESYSRKMNMKDKTVCTLFGDAATATLLAPTDSGSGFLSFDFGTDGSKFDKLIVPAGGVKLPLSNETGREQTLRPGVTRSQNDLFMDGKEIFEFALDVVPKSVEKCLARARLQLEEVDYFVFHQANKYMLEALQREMNLDSEKVVIDLKNYGNTVSSTIPIAYSNLLRSSKLKKDNKVLFCGFGVGLSWATCIYNY